MSAIYSVCRIDAKVRKGEVVAIIAPCRVQP